MPGTDRLRHGGGSHAIHTEGLGDYRISHFNKFQQGGRYMSFMIEAPMPGKIVEIKVKAGDTVKEDDELIVLEAMKMENPIYAPATGKVAEIKVAAGQNVVTGQVILVIE
jgi:acetyl-CoA carboxylase biotin carboxyl carrier protein